MKHPAVAALPDQSPLLDLLDEELGNLCESVPAALWDRALCAPARDFLGRPGKEFRARLVELSWQLGGASDPVPLELPLLVEILHAGSLIVDDIEDESDERRGAPALHRTYGVPTALNTGNWMYFWPFALIGRMQVPESVRLRLYERTSGTLMRCHEGQALDLAARVHELARRDIPNVVRATTRLKTGALMELAACLGAIAAGGSAARVDKLAAFGRELGCALQMLDDHGGLACEARRSKGLEDLGGLRPTWPWAWLALSENVDDRAFADLQADAAYLASSSGDFSSLVDRICALLGNSGRYEIHAGLSRALTALSAEVGAERVMPLANEIQRLEQSYG